MTYGTAILSQLRVKSSNSATMAPLFSTLGGFIPREMQPVSTMNNGKQ
jgi:hypothetical protein